jgi:hypothetical protein
MFSVQCRCVSAHMRESSSMWCALCVDVYVRTCAHRCLARSIRVDTCWGTLGVLVAGVLGGYLQAKFTIDSNNGKQLIEKIRCARTICARMRIRTRAHLHACAYTKHACTCTCARVCTHSIRRCGACTASCRKRMTRLERSTPRERHRSSYALEL